MNHNDELTGTHVLVHPGLTRDPAGMAGETGVITGLDHNADNAYVSFGKKGQLMYGLDALLVPRTPDEIKNVLSSRGDLNIADHTALFKMSLLLEFAQSAANRKTALSLASESETVRKHSMITVQEAFNLRHEYAMER